MCRQNWARAATAMAGGDADPDCDKPVCAVKDDMFAMMRRTAKGAAKDAGDNASSSGRGVDGVEGAQEGTHTRGDKEVHCPVDKEELGRGTWALLHTMAAYYPDKPDALRKVQARRFFDALGDLYPCTHCADDFRVDKARNPPRVESRTALSAWLCERHNEVNEKLGKEKHSCAIADLDERWLKGPPTCWHG